MHHVRLDLSHYELVANYGVRRGMQFVLHAPYDIKAQHVRYTTLEGAPYTPPYGDIHHRTETLTGITDPSLSMEFAAGPDWILGAGTTIPAGDTVANPIVLGREGKKHEHIQFGSGTFRPMFSARWTRPSPPLIWSARVEATLSLYENSHGFRAPSSIVWSVGPSYRVRSVSLAPHLTGQYQTIGKWDGETDEGSGFNNGGASMQIAIPLRGLTIVPGVYRELWSRSLEDETFHQGTTWSLAVSRGF